jgi:hypothetical protein
MSFALDEYKKQQCGRLAVWDVLLGARESSAVLVLDSKPMIDEDGGLFDAASPDFAVCEARDKSIK